MASKDRREWVDARTVLWYLVFTGFAINYLLRINLNIAIVSMIKPKEKNSTIQTSECIAPGDGSNSLMINTSVDNYTDLNTSKLNVSTEGVTQFDWNEYEQSLVLGAFFWLHWLTQIPGGMLANKYGAKLIFGAGNFIAVFLCFFVPLASSLDYRVLVFLRIVQGFIAGACWPAMHSMTARWIPPNERSKFVTAYLGSSVGAGISFPMCGLIIDHWGWKYVFYLSGTLGTIWYVAWYFLAFDSPNEHPRISDREKNYIIDSLGGSIAKKTAPAPWKALLSSVPVWVNVLSQFGSLWGLLTLLTHAPSYLKVIHGWNITSTGFFAGLPHFGRIIFAFLFSLFGDYLLRANKMSRTNVRKLGTAVSSIGQAVCLIALAQSGCNSIMALVFLTSATTIHGAVSTGTLPNLVDLSPNYAGILLGMANGSGAVGGMLSSFIIGLLTNNNQTSEQWQKVFWIAASMSMGTGIIFMIFGKADLQPWNDPSSSYDKPIHESELQSLKKENELKDMTNYKLTESISTNKINVKESI